MMNCQDESGCKQWAQWRALHIENGVKMIRFLCHRHYLDAQKTNTEKFAFIGAAPDGVNATGTR